MGKNVMGGVATVMSVTILVLFAALVIGSITDNSTFADTVTTGTNTDETLSAVDNITATTLAVISTYPDAVCDLTYVANATDGVNLTAGNYTFTESGCTLILEDDSAYIGEDLNVTYGYTDTQSNLAGINVTNISVQFGAFVTALVGFLAVIGVILAIVWLISYIKPLFSEEEGIHTFAGN